MVAVALLTGLSLLAASTPTTEAAFTAATADGTNSLATATLAAPTSFTASCVSSSRVDLSWIASPTTSVTGYGIERRRQGETVFTHLATVAGRSTQAYSDTSSPFPSSLLTLAGTVTVEYRMQAEVSGTTWRSTAVADSASGTVLISLLGISSFSCN